MTLTLREETVERFKQLRSETTSEHLPEMSDDMFLNALMDTLEAVDDGYYSEVQD